MGISDALVPAMGPRDNIGSRLLADVRDCASEMIINVSAYECFVEFFVFRVVKGDTGTGIEPFSVKNRRRRFTARVGVEDVLLSPGDRVPGELYFAPRHHFVSKPELLGTSSRNVIDNFLLDHGTARESCAGLDLNDVLLPLLSSNSDLNSLVGEVSVDETDPATIRDFVLGDGEPCRAFHVLNVETNLSLGSFSSLDDFIACRCLNLRTIDSSSGNFLKVDHILGLRDI